MKKIAGLAVILLIFALSAAGCRTLSEELKPNDEVLIYPLPFDLTYLRAFEALELVDGWEIEETEKEKGMIRVRNVQFSSFDDAETRLVTFEIKRLSRKETSVSIAPESQRVIGGDILLRKVSESLRAEI